MNTNDKSTSINVPITDLTFTPFACASLINEIIKFLVYQKSQIPYPYNWLKTSVTRKRKDNNERESTSNFLVDKSFHAAATAYNTLEEIMLNIRKQFENDRLTVHEVLLIFGATPYTPKEVFSLRIPYLARGHVERNHMQEVLKNQHKILKSLFFSETWLQAMEKPITYTNLYVMLKKTESSASKEDFFYVNQKYSVPCNAKCLFVTLCGENSDHNCCKNLTIFEDGLARDASCSGSGDRLAESTECGVWYQAKVLVKGFKDCVIDKSSASNLW